MLNDMAAGFSAALQPDLLLIALIGVLVGSLVGVLPGIGPMGTISVLLGLAPVIGPTESVVLLAGVYYGSMYGGSTTSILLKVPGEVTSVVTAIDGHEMSRRGRAGAALTVAAVGSFIAGILSIFGLAVATPLLGDLALSFGQPEYFALTVAGLLLLSVMLAEAMWKSVLMVLLGLAIATVGIDPISGTARFDFGSPDLLQGIGLVPLAMGLFGVAEVLNAAQASHRSTPKPRAPRMRELLLTRQEARRSVGPIARGWGLGFILGLIPGPSTLTSTFVSYTTERKISKHPEEFGKGAIEGVAGPESANNAAAAAAFIPMMSLGIPFTPVMALILSALLLNGIVPGPTFIADHGDLFWTVIAAMFLGNLALIVLNLPLVGLFTRVLALPAHLLMPMILVFVMVGGYVANFSMWDVWVMIAAGVFAFVLTKYGFSMTPLILAVALGPTLENSLRTSLALSAGSPSIFVTRPISLAILTVCLVAVVVRVLMPLLRARRTSAEDEPEVLAR